MQAITGAQARNDTRHCLDYGTRIVGGVTPGRGGEEVHGVPVFDTVRHAVEQAGADASVIYVPGRAPAMRRWRRWRPASGSCW